MYEGPTVHFVAKVNKPTLRMCTTHLSFPLCSGEGCGGLRLAVLCSCMEEQLLITNLNT